MAMSSDSRRSRSSKASDRALHLAAAKFTGGLSPISLGLAGLDWAWHLATQPSKVAELTAEAHHLAAKAMLGVAPPTPDSTQGWSVTDRRFAHSGWAVWPWSALASSQHAAETWWAKAVDLPGMDPHHKELCASMARQILDFSSPSNNALLNPEVLERAITERGADFVRGSQRAAAAFADQVSAKVQTRVYEPGHQVALTPGQVVYRNRLVELIQYSPETENVSAEPIFIVPSWIMKYYILDLSARNSFVGWLVEQGHTVFILSWHNPTEADAELTLENYVQLGVYQSLIEVRRIIGDEAVHTLGYCLGGTLLAVAMAALERPASVVCAADLPRIASLTLLASETDFSEPGELGLFIDESQVSLLEELMAENGYLTGQQMAGSFTYLHARDQLWSKFVHEVLLGEPSAPNDLMSWNADVTRMPARMHGEYLRRCYLRNEIADDRFPVEGQPVALSDLHIPMFVVATQTDHVSPWQSVYKIHRLADTEITFVLTSGGHNAGIVSEPGHPRRHHASLLRPADGKWIAPDRWLQLAHQHDGSWWPTWQRWLEERTSAQVPARPVDDVGLGAAPGRYVHECYAD